MHRYHYGRLVSYECPDIGWREAGITDAIMSDQIFRRARRSASRQIGGTGAHHSARPADPYPNQTRIPQLPDAHPDVHLLLRQTPLLFRGAHSYLGIPLSLAESPTEPPSND